MGAGIEVEGGELNFVTNDIANILPHAVADFLDGRSDDGGGVFGVAEFQVHAAADVHELEHGASPGGTGDGNLHRLRAELGVAGDEGVTAAQQYGGVAMVHGLDF